MPCSAEYNIIYVYIYVYIYFGRRVIHIITHITAARVVYIFIIISSYIRIYIHEIYTEKTKKSVAATAARRSARAKRITIKFT